jgi:formylmethanofuran dehydrogenase subunit D
MQWLARVTAFLESKKNDVIPGLLDGNSAAEQIACSAYEPLSIVGFNTTEAERLGVQEGDEIKVAPEDTGDLVSSALRAAASAEQ